MKSMKEIQSKLKNMKLLWLKELSRISKNMKFDLLNDSLFSQLEFIKQNQENHHKELTDMLDTENENSISGSLQKFRKNVSKVENLAENLSGRVEKLEMDENHMCDQNKVKILQQKVIFSSRKVNEFGIQNIKMSNILLNQMNQLQERIFSLELRAN